MGEANALSEAGGRDSIDDWPRLSLEGHLYRLGKRRRRKLRIVSPWRWFGPWEDDEVLRPIVLSHTAVTPPFSPCRSPAKSLLPAWAWFVRLASALRRIGHLSVAGGQELTGWTKCEAWSRRFGMRLA